MKLEKKKKNASMSWCWDSNTNYKINI